MKKSQLRKIIRKVINEQNAGVEYDIVGYECGGGPSWGNFPCMYLDNNWATTLNIGDVFMLSPPWSGGIPPSNSKTPYIITGVTPTSQCNGANTTYS